MNSPSKNSSQTEPRIDLRNPMTAGILAFLIPGAGHFYQRRYFKGAIYFICILGTFFYGMLLGEWKVVAATQDLSDQGVRLQDNGRLYIGYLAQAPVGLSALPALMQSKRYFAPENHAQEIIFERTDGLQEPLEGEFIGDVKPDSSESTQRRLTGTLKVEPAGHQMVKGTLQGEDTETGESVEYQIGGHLLLLDKPVDASPYRNVEGFLYNDQGELVGQFAGSLYRPFWNYFQVPLSPKIRNDVHGRLGKYFELALVFTWIAGFLNILAIWDALEGPAYGYGDEPYLAGKKNKDVPTQDAAVPATADKSKTASAQNENESGESSESETPAGEKISPKQS